MARVFLSVNPEGEDRGEIVNVDAIEAVTDRPFGSRVFLRSGVRLDVAIDPFEVRERMAAASRALEG